MVYESEASNSTLAASSAAKINSRLISSFLATDCRHFQRTIKAITGKTKETTRTSRLENPRSPGTCIYTAPITTQSCKIIKPRLTATHRLITLSCRACSCNPQKRSEALVAESTALISRIKTEIEISSPVVLEEEEKEAKTTKVS